MPVMAEGDASGEMDVTEEVASCLVDGAAMAAMGADSCSVGMAVTEGEHAWATAATAVTVRALLATAGMAAMGA